MDRTVTDDTHRRRQGAAATELGLVVANHPDPRFIGRHRLLRAGEPLEIGRGGRVLGTGVLDDPRISRAHAVFSRKGDAVEVQDLGSRNGTWLGRQQVERCAIDAGDVVELGRIALLVQRFPPRFAPPHHESLIGVGPALARILLDVERVAPLDTPVLLLGETGTGKELVARAIHDRSGRKGPFVALNCAGLPDELAHSELFGHVRGAFSGAHRDRTGLVQSARGGTLFLDEIGDASPGLQASLLRFLQEGEVRPLGGDRPIESDARVLAATHRDPGSEDFREDLRGRLGRWVIHLPPLRERREDIVPLALHFAGRMAGRPVRLDHRLALALLQYDWPRNVRELQGVIERTVVEEEGDVLHLVPFVAEALGLADLPPGPPLPVQAGGRPDAAGLAALLRSHHGNIAAAARELGIGRNTLYRWLREANVDLQRLRDEGFDDVTDPHPHEGPPP